MSLKAKFYWIPPKQAKQPPVLSFLIENDNWLNSESFSLMLYNPKGDTVWQYKNLTLRAGKALDVNGDTLGWVWGRHDRAKIFDAAGTVVGEWIVEWHNAQRCSCQDSHKCTHCGGLGSVPSAVKLTFPSDSRFSAFSRNRNLVPCRYCNGTGLCMECYLPPSTMQGDPKGVKPAYHGSLSFISWDTGRSVIPYSEPNIDMRLQQIDEWSARVDRMKGARFDAQWAGASPAVIRDMNGVITRAENHLKDLL
ncbi:MAG: hypothetical protein IJ618_10620 [Prevotella sp.]|nr:hypothetical protein [Bacteroidaceae bacterium]MBR1504321.1 hypothetical protein [Prevotella sp.]